MTKQKIDISPSKLECLVIFNAFCQDLDTTMPAVKDESQAVQVALEVLFNAVQAEENKGDE